MTKQHRRFYAVTQHKLNILLHNAKPLKLHSKIKPQVTQQLSLIETLVKVEPIVKPVLRVSNHFQVIM